jgi:CMP-N-acetylneuraminic acid synthetase
LSCPLISKVVVDTDSPLIIEGVNNNFPDVKIIKRPEHLCGDTIPVNELLIYDVQQVESDFYLQTHSTNPLLKSATVTRAIEIFLENYPVYNSLFSVTRYQKRYWNAVGMPMNHNPSILLRTQDILPIYEENSSIYIFARVTLEATRNRIGKHPFLYEIDRIEAWDIDEEIDFKIAEFLYRKRVKEDNCS